MREVDGFMLESVDVFFIQEVRRSNSVRSILPAIGGVEKIAGGDDGREKSKRQGYKNDGVPAMTAVSLLYSLTK